MYFPISGVHLDPIYLVLIGFVIGVLGGFFGVGGSFLTAPALFAVGLPMNYVVGTDLAHIVGKSIVAARTHRVLGNIDLKLAFIMVIGTIVGSEAGVQAIEILKKGAHVELVVGSVSIIVFTGISLFCAWESWTVLRLNRSRPPTENPKKDVTAIDGFAKALQRIKLPPQVSLPHSGIESISFWAILLSRSLAEFSVGFSAEVQGTSACLQWSTFWESLRTSRWAPIFLR